MINNNFGNKQTGFVLPIGMVMLVILTILGVGTMRDGILQEKMSSNFLDKEKSFQASESALRMVQRITLRTSVEDIESTVGFVSITEHPFDAHDFNTLDLTAIGTGFDVLGVKTGTSLNNYHDDPIAVIEEMTNSKPLKVGKAPANQELATRFFRITALGFGETVNAKTTLQGVVER